MIQVEAPEVFRVDTNLPYPWPPYQLQYNPRDEVVEWLNQHCQHKVIWVKSRTVIFRDADATAAVQFKLQWL